MQDVILKPGKERSLLRFHPWVFSGAAAQKPETAENGETVRILNSKREFLAYGSWSNVSSIACRVWSFEENEKIDGAFFRKRVESAFALRKTVFHGTLPDAYRLIHAESDGLPGVVADIYPGYAVVQLSTAGASRYAAEIAEALAPYAPEGVYERSDVDGRKREGLEERTGALSGKMPPEYLEFTENGIRFRFSPLTGHKTGFYLDQRINRAMVKAETVAGAKVLNCFCYTGGFGLAAMSGGAESVLNVDSSEPALALARENAELNGFSLDKFKTQNADVFRFLRLCRDKAEKFDMIILDPPKLAESFAQRDRAARAYKDLNLLALKLLNPGGKLFTFSCSGAMDDDLFRKVAASAAFDAGVRFREIAFLAQGPDHAECSFFPEGHYLKGIYGIRQQ